MPSPRIQHAAAALLTRAVHGLEKLSARRCADVPTPPNDPFYAAPEDLDAHAPGAILDWRPIQVCSFGRAIKADAWQVRYRTTDTAGTAVSAVATVMVPHKPSPAPVRPLVSYQCAIDSLSPRADPSYTLRRGSQKELALMGFALRRGWAVVTSDYTGPRRAYGAGLVAGRHVLDGIRAALDLEAAGLGAGTPVGLWGYSGGGQASAWAAEQHPVYASELNIAIVAAGGVPPDINAAARAINAGLFGGLALGAALGVAREFPDFDLNELLNDEGHAAVARAGDMTVDELFANFPWRHVREFTVSDDPLALPVVREVLARNDLGVVMPIAPLFYYHSRFDQLCPVGPVDALVATYRRAGVDIQYRRSVAGEHCIYAVTGAPGAVRALARGFARAFSTVTTTTGTVVLRVENEPLPAAAPVPAT